MKRIFENENYIVVEKRAGWLTTPARDKADPRPCLGLRLQEELKIQIYPVHRLDFEVAGLVIFAKNPEAHRVAQSWFETGRVVKTYWARTKAGGGEPPRDWAEWTSKLLRGKRRSYPSPQGKLSVTRARVRAVENGFWQWELQPKTGRPHQLRVELSLHGYPILGDVLYGSDAASESPGIELTAVRLDFSQIPEAERGGLPDELILK